MTQTLYFNFTFMSRRDAYYLFYKNYPRIRDIFFRGVTSHNIAYSKCKPEFDDKMHRQILCGGKMKLGIPILPVNARDKAGITRDKQGQAGTSMGKVDIIKDKVGTNRDK